MKTLRTLIVDDNVEHVTLLIECLRNERASVIAGDEYGDFEFKHVTNQREANQAAQDGEYELVLLDLRYPLEPGQKVDDDPAGGFQGMIWLPHLRRLQPAAAIVIQTTYANAGNLQHAVTAVRDGRANDFIPKTAQWSELSARIRLAIVHARRARTLELLDEEYQRLLRSHGARVYAEDIGVIVQGAVRSLLSIASDLQGGVLGAETAADKIGTQARALHEGVSQTTDRLYPGRDHLKEVDLANEVRQIILLYYERTRESDIRVTQPPEDQKLPIWTFGSDLKVAVHEVFRNALDALESAADSEKPRQVEVRLDDAPDGARIIIRDNGGGFTDEALVRCPEAGFTTRNDGKHQGIGLYVAGRMVNNVGGRMQLRNRPGGDGAEVTLCLKNLNPA